MTFSIATEIPKDLFDRLLAGDKEIEELYKDYLIFKVVE